MESIIIKRVEDTLLECGQLTQAILNSAFNAIISMDSTGEIIYWNDRAEYIFGWTSSEVIGKKLSETIIPPKFRKQHEEGIRRFVSTGQTKFLNQQLEISALHRDGSEFPVEISISATKWSGSFIFTGIVRDISARKKAEQLALIRTEEYEVMHDIAKELHESDTLDILLQEAMKTITHSRAFNFKKCAGVFLAEKDRLNFSLVSSIGDFTREFSHWDEEILLKYALHWNDMDADGESVNNCCLISPNNKKLNGFNNSGLYIVPLKKHTQLIGLLILMSSDATPSYERNKEILISIGGLIASAIRNFQCEEKTKMQNIQLEAANQNLQELHKVKNKFLGIASHDLRNPLYMINSYSQFLQDDLADKIDDKQRKFLGKIYSSSEFMENLLNNLLDISKIESGKYELNIKQENLNNLVEDQVELHKLISQKKNIDILLALEEIPPVSCDRSAMFQIMGNFIGNAIKFSPENSSILVSTAIESAFIRFSVRDEGPGICREEKNLLFGEFQTLSSRPTGGEKSTGLGLAIVKKLVSLHNGKVGVSCDQEKGSTFYFLLPSNPGATPLN